MTNLSPNVEAALRTARDLGVEDTDLSAVIWEGAAIMKASRTQGRTGIQRALDLILIGLMHEKGYIP